jgi:hypothetical protein
MIAHSHLAWPLNNDCKNIGCYAADHSVNQCCSAALYDLRCMLACIDTSQIKGTLRASAISTLWSEQLEDCSGMSISK